jgi:hypothetical protein
MYAAERARADKASRGASSSPPKKPKRMSTISSSHLRQGVTILNPQLLAIPLNSAMTVAGSLQERTGGKTLVWNLEDELPPGNTTVSSPELVNAGWEVVIDTQPPIPTLSSLFRIVQSIAAWLSLKATNKAVITCMNGKSRSSIVAAALMR